jgi:hypothetical protein
MRQFDHQILSGLITGMAVGIDYEKGVAVPSGNLNRPGFAVTGRILTVGGAGLV